MLNLLSLSGIRAERPAPPAGPLIQNVPSSVDFTIDYKYSSDEKPSRSEAGPTLSGNGTALRAPRMRQVHVTKTKDAGYFVWVDENGGKEECWLIMGVQWITPKGSRERELATSSESPYFKENLPIHIFPGFEWISASDFKGIQNVEGRNCLAFESSDADGKTSLAYVDAGTKLPVLLKTNEVSCSYTFLLSPTKPLSIPEDILGFLKREAEQTRKIMAPGAR